MSRVRFLFLGTGGSTGVPMIACSCAVCLSSSPFNKRWRASALIQTETKTFLIDAGPDLRAQVLQFGIQAIDGVILTHSHFDHIGGIEDLRPFSFRHKNSLPCLLSKETWEELKLRFHYLLSAHEGEGVPFSKLSFQIIEQDFGELSFLNTSWKYISYFQKEMKVTGYIMGSMAYVSDIREYSPQVTASLKGIRYLVLGALRFTPSEGHFNIDEAIAFAREVGAEKTWLTHIGHELDHETANGYLPADIRLAYDGLEIEWTE